MYQRWLLLFAQPSNIILDTKGNKHNVEKTWLDNGSMQITGTKPSKWSVILHPSETSSLNAIFNNTNIKKNKAKEIMKKAFYSGDKLLFNEGIDMYKSAESLENKANSALKEYNNEYKNISEKVFNKQRELYLLYGKRKGETFSEQDRKMLIKINEEFRESLNEQTEIQKRNILNKENFIINEANVKKQGPVPEIPEKYIKPKVQKNTKKINKKINKKIKEKLQEELNNESSELTDESEEDFDIKNQDGGKYKWIDL